VPVKQSALLLRSQRAALGASEAGAVEAEDRILPLMRSTWVLEKSYKEMLFGWLRVAMVQNVAHAARWTGATARRQGKAAPPKPHWL
jgi:hypothetical protein